MWGIIATWVMAKYGINKASKLLKDGKSCKEGFLTAVKDVEANPLFKSVGYGGLPNRNGEVECDAAFMNGDDLSVGCVGAIKDIESPIEVAESLSHNKLNIFLTGGGAKQYAIENGFKEKNMLTDAAKKMYEEKLEFKTPCRGHDTVGCIALDNNSSMCAGTSTSGLFMKIPGRLGDSPLIGSGYYVDSKIGGAAATGLGEDIMKRCMSYEIVRLMEEGLDPQSACEKEETKEENEENPLAEEVEALKGEIETLKAEIETLKEQIKKIAEAPAAVPVAEEFKNIPNADKYSRIGSYLKK